MLLLKVSKVLLSVHYSLLNIQHHFLEPSTNTLALLSSTQEPGAFSWEEGWNV